MKEASIPNPFYLVAGLFASLAALAAVGSALVSLEALPFFSGLRWLRVHLVTLGILAEVLFGLLPTVAASRAGGRRPAVRWDVWLALNAGLLTLLVGVPLVNGPLILAGGTLVFVAVGLLLVQLRALGGEASAAGPRPPGPGRPFYLAGLTFLLVGVVVGTGLWIGWPAALRIAVPLETHIHANTFGFLGLTFAGLLADLYPGFAGRPLAWPRSVRPIFWLMALGALLLVLGPWLDLLRITMPGVALYLIATLWLAANVLKPLLGDRAAWSPGTLHLTLAYLWFLAPILAAPMVMMNPAARLSAGIEQSAPQGLIYGWALQLGYALLPYLLVRFLLPGQPARLGGSWLSLATLNLGAACLWASMLVEPARATLYAAAYLLFAVSLLAILAQTWGTPRAGLDRLEPESPPEAERLPSSGGVKVG